jgi:purine nucleoside phosphorylase
LETPAEISLMATYAQVVGMTIASECVAACAAGLTYAAICVVENLANGVGERELTMEELLAGRAANREAVARALQELTPSLT